jgi:hypothetical protein
MQITLDTHHFIKFLEEKKHFTHEQAETLVEAAVEYTNTVGKGLATKQDIDLLKQDIILQKKDIIIWLGGIVVTSAVACTGILIAVLPLVIKA